MINNINIVIGLILSLLLAPLIASGQSLTYSTECTSRSGSVLIEDHGTITAGVSADSLDRVSNLEAVNAAIADAPAGGTVCLPSDSIYIAADQKWSDDFPDRDTRHHIEIKRDSITIMGAGACGWGDMSGCSYIGTPGSEESYMYLGPDPSGANHTDVMRGSGMAIFPGLAQGSADSARAITLKGFELHGQAEHTGDYSWNLDEDSVDTYNGWDLTHKGFHLSANPSGNLTDLKIEDVHVYGYRGEVIYNGGFGLGTVTVRRVWSHESNGSAYNIATAKDQLVEDSKFGPRVRFWGELLAEGIPNATSVHRNNTYEGCNTGDGCIALALDDSQNLADGQTWTWTNNSFDHSGSTNPHFLLESGPYDLNITDNTFQGGKLWLANFGSGGERASLNVLGNEHDTEGTHPMKWQNGYYEGVITENTFLNSASTYRAAGSTDMQGLVITNNEFDGSKGISFGGNGADVYPLLEENTYTGNGPPSPRTLYSDETIRAYSEQYAVEEGLNGPYNVELEARASDGQRVWLFGGKGEIVLPADSSNHAWTSDFSLTSSSDSVQVEFDRANLKWKETAVRKASLLNERGGWASGSANRDTIQGASAFDGASEDNGYFRFERVTNTPAVTDSFAVDTRIDSVDRGASSPFAHAALRVSADTTTSADRVHFECARMQYCRVTWRKGGTLNKGNWQRQSLPVYARIVRDGDSLTVQTRKSAADPWTGVPLDQDGFQSSDDKLHLPLGADPYVGAGVKSGNSQESMMAVFDPLITVTPN